MVVWAQLTKTGNGLENLLVYEHGKRNAHSAVVELDRILLDLTVTRCFLADKK
jgi:hypothetical protein